jgi:hypothetical protein
MKGSSAANAEEVARSADALMPTSPSRTIEVHDSKVRRIAAITPDIIRPKPHVFPTSPSPIANRSTISASGVAG